MILNFLAMVLFHKHKASTHNTVFQNRAAATQRICIPIDHAADLFGHRQPRPVVFYMPTVL